MQWVYCLECYCGDVELGGILTLDQSKAWLCRDMGICRVVPICRGREKKAADRQVVGFSEQLEQLETLV